MKSATRVRMFVTSVVLFGVMAAIGFAVRHTHGAVEIETHLLGRSFNDQINELVPRYMLDRDWRSLLIGFGEPSFFVAWLTALSVVCYVRRDLRLFAVCVAAPLTGALVLHFGFKPFFDRHRGVSFAYPSGHSGASASLAAATYFIICRYSSDPRVHRVGLLVAIAPLVTGVGMILRGAHYPLDVIGGWCCGVAFLMLAGALFDPFRIETDTDSMNRNIHPKRRARDSLPK